MSCKEIMLISAGGPAMMGSLVACIHPHMDAAIDDVRLLFISTPAAFQVNINNIEPQSTSHAKCEYRLQDWYFIIVSFMGSNSFALMIRAKAAA